MRNNLNVYYEVLTLFIVFKKHLLSKEVWKTLRGPWVQETACINGSLHANRQNPPPMENSQSVVTLI